jgi:hypothetical protein
MQPESEELADSRRPNGLHVLAVALAAMRQPGSSSVHMTLPFAGCGNPISPPTHE